MAQGGLHATSDRTVGGLVNPESVGCDERGKALHVGNFGAPKLDPAKKEGMGYISKLSLDGTVTEKQFLPAPGGEMRKLADGFKGPADFCVLRQAGGLMVVVPDLVQSQVRFIQLRN